MEDLWPRVKANLELLAEEDALWDRTNEELERMTEEEYLEAVELAKMENAVPERWN
jgi:hypothetical protein